MKVIDTLSAVGSDTCLRKWLRWVISVSQNFKLLDIGKKRLLFHVSPLEKLPLLLEKNFVENKF